MGNRRFKLSNMMPNAWFYKLKDMGRTRSQISNSHSLQKKQFPAAGTATQPSKPKQTHDSYPRKSYYYTRECHPKGQGIHDSPAKPKSRDTHFPDPPRRSSKQKIRRRSRENSPKLVSASVSAGCSCHATLWTKPDSPPDYSASLLNSSSEPDFCDSFPPEFRSDRVLTTKSIDDMVSLSGSYGCKLDSYADDVVIDVDKRSLERKFNKPDVFDNISNLDLPPIITKPAKFDDKVENITKKETTKEANKCRRSLATSDEASDHGFLSVKVVKGERVNVKEHKPRFSVRRNPVVSPGVRLRVNSPRVVSRRIQGHGRKSVSMSSSSNSSSRRSLSDSLAIMKSSFDPQRDFRDSMVEMIVENNIRASKDLEDLLACYLSLNSDEYHDLIIKVFKQIWFDLTHTQPK